MNVEWRNAAGPGSERPPLAVLFHGRGSDEQGLRDLAAAFPQPFAVALPRGPIAHEISAAERGDLGAWLAALPQ
jgi:predicted esterase